MSALLSVLLLVTSIFLILLILIQRGRGGGLAGAFGGMGGQSAFGTKAGDLFTRVTIGVTFFWILLCIVSVRVMGASANRFGGLGNAATTDTGPALPSGSGAPAGDDTTGAGKATENVSPGSSTTPAASEDKTGSMVPPPGTAGDAGNAGVPVPSKGEEKPAK
jgi:preprotein translocase subunit SecG